MASKRRLIALVRVAERALGIEISMRGRRAYYYAPETDAYYWITRGDLEYAVEVAEAQPQDTYSYWCAGTSSRTVSDRTLRRWGVEGAR